MMICKSADDLYGMLYPFIDGCTNPLAPSIITPDPGPAGGGRKRCQRKDLTRCMELYRQAGLGGVEITPIYGVAGFENQFIDYLSPRWMEVFAHTLKRGETIGSGVSIWRQAPVGLSVVVRVSRR
ncbi:MAG: hypothetical protein IPO69_17195 [Saprospiraceae bacterium]|nr:hypothetical protein [Saprospiraceae bacterium]